MQLKNSDWQAIRTIGDLQVPIIMTMAIGLSGDRLVHPMPLASICFLGWFTMLEIVLAVLAAFIAFRRAIL